MWLLFCYAEHSKTRVCAISGTVESIAPDIKKLTLPDAWDTYKRLKPVADKVLSIKFTKAKEKYKAEHKSELNQFYAANRLLTKYCPDGKYNSKAIQTRYAEMEQQHEVTNAEFQQIRAESQQLWKIKSHIDTLEDEIQRQENQTENVDKFIRQDKKYLHLEKLTPAVLNDLVKAVYVHAPDNSSGHRVQDVEISYNYIGILPATLLYDLQNGKTA